MNSKVLIVVCAVAFTFSIFNIAEADAPRKINIDSLAKTYTEGDQVTFYVTSQNSDGDAITSDQGYHVQFYLKKKNTGKKDGAVGFNAEDYNGTDGWAGKFIAPAPGKYQLDITLYCATDDGECSRLPSYYQKTVTKTFTVKRGQGETKKSVMVSEGYVTYDIASDQNPVIAELPDGSLAVYFNSSRPDGAAGIYHTTSKNGTSWSKPKYFSDSWSDIDALTDGKSLLIFQMSSGIGLEIVDKKKKHRVTPTKINDSVGSILKAKNGYYYASYSSGYPAKLYVTKTKKLTKWSAPVRVFSGSDSSFDSSLAQAPDGTIYLAYNSYSNNGVDIVSSVDGTSWKFEKTISASTNAHSGITMIMAGDTPVVFWGDSHSTYYSKKIGNMWTQPKIILTGTPFGIDAIVRNDGTVTAVYTVEHDNQRDIKIKNLGQANTF